jgi:hypothetical protein
MTESKSRWVVFAIGVALLTTSIACGGDASGSLSPTGPSGTRSGGAVINGRVRGLSTPVTANSFAPLATSSVRVTITGTNISTNVDGNGQFTLTGVPPGDVTMQFSGPGVSASITLKGVTTDQQITIDVTLNGNNARLDSDTRRDNDGRDNGGRDTDRDGLTEVTGSVSALTGACPAITFMVRDRAVVTNGNTRFDGGCDKIKNAVRVEAKGAVAANGALMATSVELDD